MNIVFDLDGTLANIEHRLHLIEGESKHWPSFYRSCINDTPILPVVLTCHALILVGHCVDIWSGRSDEVRGESEDWLNRHAIGYRKLIMRREGDSRPDHIMKADWLREMPKSEWPEIVFDDRQKVVDMWRAHGIRCCQVAPGKF